MAQRKSTGLIDFIAKYGSAQNALSNSRVYIYSGAQPTTADEAPTGTLLCTLTKAGNTFTAETLPQWTVTLSGASGSVDTITIGDISLIGGYVPFTTDLAGTATAVATAINSFNGVVNYTASSNGAVITIYGPVGSGAQLNDCELALTTTTLVATYNALTTISGVNCINGCSFIPSATAGTLSKEATSWVGTTAVTGNAGWFRIKADPADNDTVSTVFRRLDGAISVSGAEMNLGSTTLTSGRLFSITDGTFTIVR